MIRDASEEGNDGVILEGYTVRDLDEETIKNIGIGIYIRDLFANINFDYREEIDVNSIQRWSDRFTIDGTWENNLYNFYFTVINKLTSNIKVPFKLENLERKDDTAIHQAIREAFVNQIIHADFNIQGTLKHFMIQ